MRSIILSIALLAACSQVFAASNVGQCVYPKSKPGKGGRLEFIKPIYISPTPAPSEKQVLTTFDAFTIKAEANGFVQLATVPGVEDAPIKTIGWVKLSDFKIIDLRNCN